MAEDKKDITFGKIGNALKSVAADHVTVFAEDVFDETRQEYQSEINQTLQNEIEEEANRAKAAEEANAAAIEAEAEKLSGLEGKTDIYDNSTELSRNMFDVFDEPFSLIGSEVERIKDSLKIKAILNGSYKYATFKLNVIGINNITVSCGDVTGDGSGTLRVAKSNGEGGYTWLNNVYPNTNRTFDVSSIDEVYIALYAVQDLNTGVGKYLIYDRVQVEAGSSASEYVPHIVMIDKDVRSAVKSTEKRVSTLEEKVKNIVVIKPVTSSAEIVSTSGEIISSIGNVIYHSDTITAKVDRHESLYRAVHFKVENVNVGGKIKVSANRTNGNDEVSRIRFIGSDGSVISTHYAPSDFIVVPNDTKYVEVNLNLCWGTAISDSTIVTFSDVNILYEVRNGLLPTAFQSEICDIKGEQLGYGDILYHADTIVAKKLKDDKYSCIRFNINEVKEGKRICIHVGERINGEGFYARLRFLNQAGEEIANTRKEEFDQYIPIPSGCVAIEAQLNLCWDESLAADTLVTFNDVSIFYEPDKEFDLPDYYNDYIKNKTERVNEVCSKSSVSGDSFVFITDEHWDFSRNQKKSIPLLKYLYEHTHINKLFSGGDIADGCLEDSFNLVNTINKIWLGDAHFCVGNHEYINNPNADENVVHYLYGRNNKGHVGNNERHYYYVDYADKKLRYIVISPFAPSTNGGASAGWGYELEQRNWLDNIALNLEEGWKSIIITHALYWIGDDERIMNISDDFAAVIDIVNRHPDDVIAVFQGHMHRDRVARMESRVPVIFTTCDKNIAQSSTEYPYINQTLRKTNTTNEQAFDVISYNKNESVITCVRIGCPAQNGFGDNYGDYMVEERIIYLKPILVGYTLNVSGGGTLESNDSAVASVSGRIVTGVSAGNVVITENHNGKRRSFYINVI